jgi:hypothetical protein
LLGLIYVDRIYIDGAAGLPWPEATAVGGWWNRAFDPEIDLIGADRAPVAKKLWYAESANVNIRHPYELSAHVDGEWCAW